MICFVRYKTLKVVKDIDIVRLDFYGFCLALRCILNPQTPYI